MKVGDRIMVHFDNDSFKDNPGTVIYVEEPNILVEFDIGSAMFHDGGRRGKDGFCYWLNKHHTVPYSDSVDLI